MHTFDEAFGGAFCVNLDRRPDRWAAVAEQFELHELSVERHAAVDGALTGLPAPHAGRQGAIQSHFQVIGRALETGLDSVVIFEDDVFFREDFRRQFDRVWPHVPADWNMLYFGGNCTRWGATMPVPYRDGLWQCTRTLTAHAVALRRTVFEAALDYDSRRGLSIDAHYMERVQPEGQAFIFRPPVAFQRDGFSDVEGKEISNDFFRWYPEDDPSNLDRTPPPS